MAQAFCKKLQIVIDPRLKIFLAEDTLITPSIIWILKALSVHSVIFKLYIFSL